MRKIKFRGKKVDCGKWIYGIPITTKIGTFIVYEENPHYCSLYGYMEIDELGKVNPETVGQYTGLKDKNGQEIYEGDIVEFDDYEFWNGTNGNSFVNKAEVCFKDGKFAITNIKNEDNSTEIFKLSFGDIEDGELLEESTVIGNIYENQGLIKEDINE